MIDMNKQKGLFMRFDGICFMAVLCATGCSVVITDQKMTETKVPVVEETFSQPAGYVPFYSDAFKMKYGLFIHWVGTSRTSS
jgi:hypothetical protein